MANNPIPHTGNGAQKIRYSKAEAPLPGSGRETRLTKVLQKLWDVKVRLQFTGWLQYIPTAALALVFAFAAWITRRSGHPGAASPLELISGALAFILVFDLVTVKFKLRPPETLPARRDGLDIFDLMRSRRSCRSYQLRKLKHSDRAELMEAVRRHGLAPTLGNAPVRFEYVSAALTVWPVVNATEFLIAIAPAAYDRLAVIDVGRTLQKIVMDATRMGLGTCWIGPGADHASIIQALGDRFDPKIDHIICACAVGYPSWYLPLVVRAMNLQFHRRLPLSRLFFADDEFEIPLDVDRSPFVRFGRTYEICQWAPSSYNGQTTRCVAVTAEAAGKPQLERFDFYAAAGSRYYAPVALGIWLANWELGCEALGIEGHLVPQTERKTAAQPYRCDASWIVDEDLPLA